MSLLLKHDAFCFDSFKDKLLWVDDFEGDQLKDEWTAYSHAGGSVAVVDGQDGGVVRLTTHSDNWDEARIHWNDIRGLLVSKNACCEARVKVGTFDGNQGFSVALYYDFINCLILSGEWWGANWVITTYSGGVFTQASSNTLVDANRHILRIQCHTHGANHGHFYVDNAELNISPIATNIPINYLQPYISVYSHPGVQTLDVDYCGVSQDR